MADNKPWLSGEPYYCKTCGLCFAEYIACEDGECELESKEEAMKRRHHAGAPKTNKTALMSREEIERFRSSLSWGYKLRRDDQKRLCEVALDIYDKAIEDAAQAAFVGLSTG